jgi:hypothetical protein
VGLWSGGAHACRIFHTISWNPLNNVVLEGNFVSGWHGIIRFDNTGTYYLDLGSTNGTCLDGKKLQKNTAIPIQQTTRFSIWMFELIVTPCVPGTLSTPQQGPSSVGPLAATGRSTEVYQMGATPQPPSHAHSSPSRIIPVGGARMPTPPSASHGGAQAFAPVPGAGDRAGAHDGTGSVNCAIIPRTSLATARGNTEIASTKRRSSEASIGA